MDVIIQGYGVVGRQTERILGAARRGHAIYPFDPAVQPVGDLPTEPDVVVVCTPCRTGRLDDLGWVIDRRPRHVVVRSTVTPAELGRVKAEGEAHEFSVHHWPEFLTQSTADHDAFHPDKFLWGTHDTEPGRFLDEFLGITYQAYRRRGIAVVTTPDVSSLAKLAINSFYTLKTVFFNALWDTLGDRVGDGRVLEEYYEALTVAMGLDRRITLSHHEIWHGGYRGAGGKCLPKDLRNFTEVVASPYRDWFGELLAVNAQLNMHVSGNGSGGHHRTLVLVDEEPAAREETATR